MSASLNKGIACSRISEKYINCKALSSGENLFPVICIAYYKHLRAGVGRTLNSHENPRLLSWKTKL